MHILVFRIPSIMCLTIAVVDVDIKDCSMVVVASRLVCQIGVGAGSVLAHGLSMVGHCRAMATWKYQVWLAFALHVRTAFIPID